MTASRIFVGVDGSPGSVRALRWALEEAGLRQASVEAVYVFPFRPYLGDAWTYGMTPQIPSDVVEAEQKEAEEHLAAVLDQHLGDFPGVDVGRHVLPGRPARKLLDLARDADLLVLGSRGHGGFKGLLLGSVSLQCVQHAECPVVIIPEGASSSPEHVTP
jgi:nucleotide-binding universal stress UspA family protein